MRLRNAASRAAAPKRRLPVLHDGRRFIDAARYPL